MYGDEAGYTESAQASVGAALRADSARQQRGLVEPRATGVPGVHAAVGELQTAIEHQGQALAELAKRLEHAGVLRNDPRPERDNRSARGMPSSGLGQAIVAAAGRVENHTAALAFLLEQLDI